MKTRNALLIGWAIVIIAYVAATIAGDPALFKRISEWVFFITIIIAALILLSGGKPGRERTSDRQAMYKATGGRYAMPPEIEKTLNEKKKKSPEELKEERKQSMLMLRTLIIIALPSVLAVLLDYYL